VINSRLSHAIRLADEQIRLALESGEAVGWDWDPKSGRGVWFGDLKMFGLPVDSDVGRIEDFLRSVHPDDRQAVWRAVGDAWTARTTYRATYRIVRADNTTRWVTATGRFHYSASGEAVRMLGVAADITDRIAIEEARTRLAAIVSSCDDPIISMALDGTISTWNLGAQRVYGFTEAEAVGHPITLLVPPELRDEEAQIIDRLKAGGRVEHYDTIRLTKDAKGVDVSVTMSPVCDFAGRVVGASEIAHERTQADQSLREGEERFRLVADTAPVMIWMAGEDMLRNYVNRTWLEFTGRPIESEVGNRWAEGIHADERKRCLDSYRKAFDARETFRMEYRLRRRDGEYRSVFDTGVPLFTPDGSFGGYIGSAVDVTEHKRAEDVLAGLSRRLMDAHEKERTRIARELHDDIGQRTALLTIELDRLRRSLPRSASSLRQLAQDVYARTIDLGKDIQAISHRLHSSKLDYLGIEAAAASLCKEVSAQQQVTIEFRHEGIPDDVPKDVALGLYRVLQEGISNAVKHAGVGHVTVTLRGCRDEIELEIVDAGSGFNPTAALTGGGLGLISMQERLSLVNGNISIESRPGAGTRIRARVPLNRPGDGAFAVAG
jgi:PAS domain S-box-containing protein